MLVLGALSYHREKNGMVTKHEAGMPHNSQEAKIDFQATNQTYFVVKAITDWPCFQI